MRVIDNFLFSNEFDMLELRLETMYDSVDTFVIVESDHTFTNTPKEYNLEKNINRYSKWADKIVYLKVKSPKYNSAWDNEFWSRDQFKLAWNDLQTGDILLISDCDEIIRPESISFIRNSSYDYYALMSPIFNFKFNYLNTSNEYTVWPVAYRYYPDVDYVPSGMRRVSNERDLFRHRFGEGILLHHAAWHFSSLGNDEFVKNKLKSFSHTEFNTSEYVDNVNIDKHIIENKNHINQNSGSWRRVKLDEYFPKPILENIEKYRKYICEEDNASVIDYYNYNILQEEV